MLLAPSCGNEAIEILVPDVTIDLNGFGIQGNGWNRFGGKVLRGNNSGSGETSGFIQIDGNICGNDLVCP
jgi:hypothetical protein